MPLNDCESDGLPGVKWGNAGKCYTYQPGDEAGRDAAVAKALAQAVAIGDLPPDEAASADADEVRAPGDVDLTPTEAVARAARKGLRLHEEGKSGDGLVAQTVRDARRMANREPLSEDKVRRMPAWWARHRNDWTATDAEPGEESPGYVAALLWGVDSKDGSPGATWAARKVRELDRAEDDRQQADEAGKDTDDMATRDEGASWMTARQRALADKLDKIADTFGPWDGGIGANGAHYIPPAENPWTDDGLACARCAFYRGGGGCKIVGQQVDPDGLCRFWIVPDPDAPAEDMPVMDDGEDMPDDAAPATVAPSGDEGPTPDMQDAARVERALSPGKVEWRESGAGPDYRTVVGYAAVWDSMSEDLGGFREVIKRGAFADALASGDEVRFVLGHDMDTVMARTSNGSLELVEDDTGLRVWARIALDDPDAQRLDAKLRSGAMSQMSFAFTMPPEGKGESWDYSGGVPVRSVERVAALYEVSAVGAPAYAATTLAARAAILEDAISSGRLPTAGATDTAPDDPVGGTPQAARLGTDDKATREAAARWRARLARIRKELT
jgi:HK97 family phage prohead protease